MDDLVLYPLLFRRTGPPVNRTDPAQVVMVGDTSIARGVAEAAGRYGLDFPLSQATPRLRAADLAVGNYEGVLAAEGIGRQRTGGYRLRANPEAASALARAGFGLLNLANNHTMDWGSAGLQATAENLQRAGIATVGVGATAQAAGAPKVTTVRGVRIAWLSFNMVSDPADASRDQENGWTRSQLTLSGADMQAVRQQLSAQIGAARSLGDALIVQFHWGIEYAPAPVYWQVDLAHAAIDAGATLVVGHHPHVVQSYEIYQDHLIVYSLGNFLFDQDESPGLALWIRLDTYGVIDVYGLALDPGVRPVWNPPAKAAANLRNRCQSGPRRTYTIDYAGGQYRLTSKDDAVIEDTRTDDEDVRLVGSIDMQGDGTLERVTIQDHRLHVFRDDQEVYQSAPSWYVVDVAVGDPNQDGRFEVIMLLLRQETPGARVTAHPFIVGYRGGAYKVLWGGSQPPDWIEAIGIADINGDRLDEFLTIERDRQATPCEARYRVVITRWNGWGFTRLWESREGFFTGFAKPLDSR